MEKERLTELVKKAQGGDKSALAELYFNYKDSVYFTAGKMMGSVEDAEDVLTETTEIMLSRIDTLDIPEAFFSWIRMIADSVIIRRMGSEFSSALAVKRTPNVKVGDAAAIGKDKFNTEEVRGFVASLVDTLPADLKLCAYMFYYQRLAVENIAKVLGIEKNAATAKLYSTLNDIEAAAAQHETAAGTLTAVPAWLIAAALQESASHFSVNKERAFEIINDAARKAYAAPAAAEQPATATAEQPAAAPAAAPVAESVEQPAEPEVEPEDEPEEEEEKPKKKKGLFSRRRDDDYDDEDDEDEEDEDEDDEEDDEDWDDEDDNPGFFGSIWGKIVIIVLVLAVIGAAVALILPKVLKNSSDDDSASTTQSDTVDDTATDDDVDITTTITADSIVGTYYGYYTQGSESAAADDTLTLNADGTWSRGSESGTYLFDDASYNLTLTDASGNSTEWNCWLDESGVAISQKVGATDTETAAYNYYQTEQLRDDALAAVSSNGL